MTDRVTTTLTHPRPSPCPNASRTWQITLATNEGMVERPFMECAECGSELSRSRLSPPVRQAIGAEPARTG